MSSCCFVPGLLVFYARALLVCFPCTRTQFLSLYYYQLLLPPPPSVLLSANQLSFACTTHDTRGACAPSNTQQRCLLKSESNNKHATTSRQWWAGSAPWRCAAVEGAGPSAPAWCRVAEGLRPSSAVLVLDVCVLRLQLGGALGGGSAGEACGRMQTVGLGCRPGMSRRGERCHSQRCSCKLGNLQRSPPSIQNCQKQPLAPGLGTSVGLSSGVPGLALGPTCTCTGVVAQWLEVRHSLGTQRVPNTCKAGDQPKPKNAADGN